MAHAARKVKLATIHFRPSGKSPQANCEEFAPLIEDAAKQKADLVVLGETLSVHSIATAALLAVAVVAMAAATIALGRDEGAFEEQLEAELERRSDPTSDSAR